MPNLTHVAGQVNLQATLSASSAGADSEILPHHPITCVTDLRLHEDGRLECDHAVAPPDSRRTILCLQHSVAILIIECAVRANGEVGHG